MTDDHKFLTYKAWRSTALFLSEQPPMSMHVHGDRNNNCTQEDLDKGLRDAVTKVVGLWQELKGYPMAVHTVEKCICPLCLMKEIS